MQRTIFIVTWTILTLVILALVLGGLQPILLQSPGVALALGMIGLGLCKHARERHTQAAQLAAARHPTEPTPSE